MLRISKANDADLPAIQALLTECKLPVDDLHEAMLGHFLVVRRAGKAVACIGMERYGDAALLRSLAVDPGMRGDGLGQQMVAALEAQAQYDGVTALYLLTTSAAQFFERLDYQRIARDDVPAAIQATEQFSRLCPASADCLAKTL